MEHRYTLTAKEAAALAKRQPAGTKFCFHVWSNAPVAGNENQMFTDGVTGSLSASRAACVAYLEKCLTSTLEARGARVKVREYVGVGEQRYFWVG